MRREPNDFKKKKKKSANPQGRENGKRILHSLTALVGAKIDEAKLKAVAEAAASAAASADAEEERQVAARRKEAADRILARLTTAGGGSAAAAAVAVAGGAPPLPSGGAGASGAPRPRLPPKAPGLSNGPAGLRPGIGISAPGKGPSAGSAGGPAFGKAKSSKLPPPKGAGLQRHSSLDPKVVLTKTGSFIRPGTGSSGSVGGKQRDAVSDLGSPASMGFSPQFARCSGKVWEGSERTGTGRSSNWNPEDLDDDDNQSVLGYDETGFPILKPGTANVLVMTDDGDAVHGEVDTGAGDGPLDLSHFQRLLSFMYGCEPSPMDGLRVRDVDREEGVDYGDDDEEEEEGGEGEDEDESDDDDDQDDPRLQDPLLREILTQELIKFLRDNLREDEGGGDGEGGKKEKGTKEKGGREEGKERVQTAVARAGRRGKVGDGEGEGLGEAEDGRRLSSAPGTQGRDAGPLDLQKEIAKLSGENALRILLSARDSFKRTAEEQQQRTIKAEAGPAPVPSNEPPLGGGAQLLETKLMRTLTRVYSQKSYCSSIPEEEQVEDMGDDFPHHPGGGKGSRFGRTNSKQSEANSERERDRGNPERRSSLSRLSWGEGTQDAEKEEEKSLAAKAKDFGRARSLSNVGGFLEGVAEEDNPGDGAMDGRGPGRDSRDRGRDGEKERGREKGRDGERERVKDRERSKEGEREKGRNGGRDRGRDGERERRRDGPGERDRERQQWPEAEGLGKDGGLVRHQSENLDSMLHHDGRDEEVPWHRRRGSQTEDESDDEKEANASKWRLGQREGRDPGRDDGRRGSTGSSSSSSCLAKGGQRQEDGRNGLSRGYGSTGNGGIEGQEGGHDPRLLKPSGSRGTPRAEVGRDAPRQQGEGKGGVHRKTPSEARDRERESSWDVRHYQKGEWGGSQDVSDYESDSSGGGRRGSSEDQDTPKGRETGRGTLRDRDREWGMDKERERDRGSERERESESGWRRSRESSRDWERPGSRQSERERERVAELEWERERGRTLEGMGEACGNGGGREEEQYDHGSRTRERERARDRERLREGERSAGGEWEQEAEGRNGAWGRDCGRAYESRERGEERSTGIRRSDRGVASRHTNGFEGSGEEGVDEARRGRGEAAERILRGVSECGSRSQRYKPGVEERARVGSSSSAR